VTVKRFKSMPTTAIRMSRVRGLTTETLRPAPGLRIASVASGLAITRGLFLDSSAVRMLVLADAGDRAKWAY
jgi:hypothetical protein